MANRVRPLDWITAVTPESRDMRRSAPGRQGTALTRLDTSVSSTASRHRGFRPLHVAGYGDGFYAARSACALCSSKIGRSKPDGNSAQTGKARSSRKKWMPSLSTTEPME